MAKCWLCRVPVAPSEQHVVWVERGIEGVVPKIICELCRREATMVGVVEELRGKKILIVGQAFEHECRRVSSPRGDRQRSFPAGNDRAGVRLNLGPLVEQVDSPSPGEGV